MAPWPRRSWSAGHFFGGVGSGQDAFDDGSVDVGEAEVSSLKAVGEAFVIETEEVEDGGLEVMDVDLVGGYAEPEFVGFSVAKSFFHAAAGEEEGVGIGEVIAAEGIASAGAAFAERGAAEFTAPDDEGVIEHAALAQVADQGGDGFVGAAHFVGQAAANVFAGAGAVEIPSPVEEVDEAHALFEQSSAEQAVIGKAGLTGHSAVGFQCFG